MHVGRSVDHVMSAQYFLIHLLESFQLGTLIGCPRVDAPYLFSGHKDKGQRQTVGHCTNDFNPFCLRVAKLDTVAVTQYA